MGGELVFSVKMVFAQVSLLCCCHSAFNLWNDRFSSTRVCDDGKKKSELIRDARARGPSIIYCYDSSDAQDTQGWGYMRGA